MRQLLSNLLWSLPDTFLLTFLRLRSRVRGTDVLRYTMDPLSGLYVASVKGYPRLFAVAERRRLALISRGVLHRIHALPQDYFLTPSMLRAGDLILDCGANCGELGLWADLLGASYLGFEPDPHAYQALQFNLGDDKADNRGLSDRAGYAELNIATASGDSSLFTSRHHSGPVLTVPCTTLDKVLDERGIAKVRLLKVEAEGWEPEVLAGASRLLEVTDYVAVDAGPERDELITAPQVVNILTAQGFKLKAMGLTRGCLLFESKNIVSP